MQSIRARGALSLALLSTGCATLEFSDPVSGIARAEGTIPATAAPAQRVGSVDVSAMGGRKRWSFGGPLLPVIPLPPSKTAVVYVLIDATVPRTGELVLDSAGITLELARGERAGPVAQWGGEASTVIMHEGTRVGCGASPIRRTLRADGTWSPDHDNGLPHAITIREAGCVELRFEFPAEHLKRALVRLDGVRVGGAPILHVPLCLAVGREWTWEFLYRWGAPAKLAGSGHEATTCAGAGA